ncbi:hypothetical protein SynPROS91_00730 [Synechococcus sp. PROS-9-1]|nr:hypothetical protein SynPROS91_00730 [Synechococcus sp. PROS-9-1]
MAERMNFVLVCIDLESHIINKHLSSEYQYNVYTVLEINHRQNPLQQQH